MPGTNPAQNPIYGNYKVFSPTDELMFRCGEDKADWYLRKNLAERIDGQTNSLRLLFQPKGNGFSGQPFFLQERDNRCVCCGKYEDLSRHHVVPYCYRVHFPRHIREHNYHDILPLCTTCHSAYEEEHALLLRQQLAVQYDAPMHGYNPRHLDPIELRAKKGAIALLNHAKRMPDHRRLELFEVLCQFLGRPPQENDIEALAGSVPRKENGSFKSHGELVVERIEDLQSFVETWRFNFLDTMKPKFLPEGWNPKINIDISARKTQIIGS